MSKNYTIIKISLYSIIDKDHSVHWSLIYDTMIVFKGIRKFDSYYNSVLNKFKIFNLKPYDYKNLYFYEGKLCDNVGIMIRGFKCYKYLDKNLDYNCIHDEVIIKDIRKTFIKII